MPGFASYDDLIYEITTNGKSQPYDFFKAALGTAGVAGVWQSLWGAGGWPVSGANPASGAGTNVTSGTAGGMIWPDVSTDLRYGLSLGATSTVSCNLMIYDRLCHTALSGTNAITTTGTGRTITMTVPRYTGTYGYNNQLWIEYTTAQGATSTGNFAVASYTDANGNASLSGAYSAIATASATSGCMWPLPLSAGKRGITAVSTFSQSGTAPTAGVANLVIIRPLVTIPLSANIWNEKDLVMQLVQMPRIWDGACLGFAVQNTGTGQPVIQGRLDTGYG